MKQLTTHFSKLSLLFIFSATTLIHCTRAPKDSQVDPAFSGYISAFTSGIISNASSIRIRLIEAVADADLAQPLDIDVFEFTPGIEGKTYWVDNQTLEFRPDKKLPSGKLYDGEFHLSKILSVPEKLRTLEFQFQTMRQSLSVSYNGIEAYDSKKLDWQKAKGQVSTADFAEDATVEKSVSAIQNGKNLSISWEHNVDGRNHLFIIDSISRQDNKQEVVLQWKGELLGIKDNGEQVIEIPPLGDFKVINVIATQQPEQVITVYFSDPVNEEMDINGLLHLSTGETVRLDRDGNTVKIYPQNRLTGNVTVIVEQQLRSSMGYQMASRHEHTIAFTDIKPAVELVGNGVILPGGNGLVFPFKAVNISEVNVKVIKIFENNVAYFLQVNQFDGTQEMKRLGRIVAKKKVLLKSDKPIDYGKWNTFSLDFAQLIDPEPGAIYRIQISFDKSQSLYPCKDGSENNLLTEQDEREEKEESSYDDPANYYYEYDYYRDYEYYYDEETGEYEYQRIDTEDPCKKSYYTRRNRSVSRNVLASDLGIIAKGGNGKEMTIAVADLKTAQPLNGVSVELYNYQNQLITKKNTNSDGLATIELDKKPFLLVAKQGKQRGYLRLDDGSALSLSMFDIGGQVNKKGVKGFIYGERGVWRPGDSLYLSFILEDKNQVIPENHPVVFELYSPTNQLKERKVKTTSLNGFYDFRTATDPDAPTGNWTAKVKVGGSEFSQTVKIETVKPNRLKIKLDFKTAMIKDGDEPKGHLEVKWLHGAIASGLKADVVMKLSEGKTAFESFPDFVFDDPSKRFESEEQKVFDGELDDEGLATVEPEIKINSGAPGMLKAKFEIRAFEKGGDFSTDQLTLPYSPYRSYVGVKIPEGKGWNKSLYSNEKNLIPVVAVDENGKGVSRENVVIEIYDIYWRWWWEHQDDDDLASYVSNERRSLLKRDTIKIVNGKAQYEMNLNGNYWGRKLLRIVDPESGHSCGQTFYTSYKGWWNSSGTENPGGAEMLTFSTDKKKYNVGDEIKVELPVSKEGKAFVSIESGSKVIQTLWAKTSPEKNSFSFKATKEMAPNVYVHVSFIQPHNQTINDLPIRMYGVQPVLVEDAQTHLEPVIEMPDVLAPEQEVTIKVKEAKGKKMTYTVAVVDEGLLDLTRFNTPDPWKTFYAREALGVKTWDMYKYVIGAFGGEMAGLLALGGDEDIKKAGGKKANRFKPVVTFLGPFEVNANGKNTHKFMMPNYVGSVRTMVVAGYDGAYGSAEKTTPVKKPLMVLATLPRVAGPGETVVMPITVFAMDKKIKEVSVEVQTNDFFTSKSGNTQKVVFAREGDQVVNFELLAAEKIGIGRVKVTVKSGKEIATYDVEMDVRTPNPRIKDVIDGVIEPGQSWETAYNVTGIAGTNNGTVEISRIPPLNLDDRMKYLIQYPHGCIEQTTSSVFPQLHLTSLLDLNKKQQEEIAENIRAGIRRLSTFQTSDGGLSYWPGENESSDWGSNYGGHFLVEAKTKGYSLPPDLLNNWIGYQQKMANLWETGRNGHHDHGYYNSDDLIQAYRLYTLALAGKPSMGAMNRMREGKDISVAAKWRLAGAYLLSGKKSIAESMVADLTYAVKPYKELSYSYGSGERDEAMILEVLALMGEKIKAVKLIDNLTKKMASGYWYSTQTTAYTLLAVAKYLGVTSDRSKEMTFKYEINSKNPVQVATFTPVTKFDLGIKGTEGGKVKINNTSNQTLFVKVRLDGIPLTGDQTNSSNNLALEVNYSDMDGNRINPSSLEQGTDFIAEVIVKNTGTLYKDYKEMALTQIFPSGWEIKNLRLMESESKHTADKPRYQDIRDDRVYSYFDIAKGGRKTFRVLLNASYLGRFYLPTVYCEAMYDNDINARVAGKWVEVTEPGGKAGASK